MNKKGYIILQTLLFASIAVIIVSGLIAWAGTNIRASRQALARERALQIAEGGIDYYRWHLAHAPQDYIDASTTPPVGPFIHPFYDKDGVLIGQFELTITPPPIGSTIVTIESKGKVVENPSISRTIQTRLAIPSFAKYAFVSNSDMRFGQGTEVFGLVHSNGGIRFDGVAHNIVSSARSDYNDPDHSGNNEFGVHTHVNAPPATGVNDAFRPNEAPPTSPVPLREDVFGAGRQLSVPSVDFVGITSDLAQIKADAQTSGRYYSASGVLGYHIVLKDNDRFDIYRVTAINSTPSGCTNELNESGWGVWSIRTQTLTAANTNVAFPANGLIFVEDNVWVDGTINTARLTIASGRFPDNPSTRTNIIVNDDISYTNIDGQDVLALIAQNNINIGLYSENNLEIDAALMAQNGRVGRYYYDSNCRSGTGGSDQNPGDNNEYVRNSITLYGMIGTYLRYGFAWTDGTGYVNRTITYDANLLYGPPPSFPLTSDQYTTISWEEL